MCSLSSSRWSRGSIVLVCVGLLAASACEDTPPPGGPADAGAGDGGLVPACRPPQSPVRLGTAVEEVAVGDFDKDGLIDVAALARDAVADLGGGQVIRVSHGRGDGTFGEPTLAALAAAPLAAVLVAADLDGDGRADLITLGEDDQLRVLRAQPDGGFRGSPAQPLGDRCEHAVAAELTGDGVVDLAFVCAGSRSVRVLPGDGIGGLRSALVHFLPASVATPRAVALVDANGDGRRDLLLAAYDSAPQVFSLVSLGDGSFADGPLIAVGAGGQPRAIAGADLDGDGRLDWALADGASLRVWLARTNAVSLVESIALRALTAADLDRDGRADLIGAGEVLATFLGTGDGGFARARRYLGGAASAQALATADVADDGRLDVLTVDPSAALHVHAGVAGGDLDGEHLVRLGPETAATELGDLDGDGRPDVTFVRGGQVWTTRGDEAGRWAAPETVVSSGFQATTLALGDVNEDGHLDAVVGTLAPTVLATFHGAGDGTLTYSKSSAGGSAPPTWLQLADADFDGHLDAILTAPTGLSWARGTGDGTFVPPVTISFDAAERFALADFNRDGRPDVVGPVPALARVTVALYGPGGYGATQTYPAGVGATELVACDLERDGDDDVVGIAVNGGTAILRSNGMGVLTAAESLLPDDHPTHVACGDLDGDGAPDIVSTTVERSVAISLAAAGRFAPVTRRPIAQAARVWIADVDGDGRRDIVVAHQNLDGADHVGYLRGPCY